MKKKSKKVLVGYIPKKYGQYRFLNKKIFITMPTIWIEKKHADFNSIYGESKKIRITVEEI